MGANAIGKSEVTATNLEIIEKAVQKELTLTAVLAATCRDVSDRVVKGVTEVSFPKTGQLSMVDKVENTPTSAQKLTFDKDTLPLDKYKHVYAEVEDDAELESVVSVDAEVIKRMITASVRQFEADLKTTIYTGASGNRQMTGSVGNDAIARADILNVRTQLDKAFVPRDGRILVVSPDQEEVLLNIENFIDASKYGSSAPIRLGEIGRIYGMPVLMSTSFGATEAAIYTRDHTVWARAQGVKFEKQRGPLSELMDEYSLSMKYGSKALDDGVYCITISDAVDS